jgi:hypothetical protein
MYATRVAEAVKMVTERARRLMRHSTRIRTVSSGTARDKSLPTADRDIDGSAEGADGRRRPAP